MNVMVLPNNEAFSKLTSDKIAKHHFIAYGDGNGYFRIVKDRISNNYGARISENTLHWHLLQKNTKN
jgi:hypothetical protein